MHRSRYLAQLNRHHLPYGLRVFVEPNHRAYKADVGGSKPSAPTRKETPSRSWLGVFGIRI
ncbi:hypothetical protein [Streptomyces sp. NPDC006446]|uniref:hypothetical protein n=1 Tax=Streptomyces sp. NPDC006446 TaxID=3154301 RepID=UPI0033A57F99